MLLGSVDINLTLSQAHGSGKFCNIVRSAIEEQGHCGAGVNEFAV